ncbi:MAG: hypothetical protein AAF299_20060, partial [Pseudomonadota bacterium]
MKFIRRSELLALPVVTGVLCLVLLAACSSTPDLTDDFISAGVRPPSGQCTVDPRSIADAVSIGNVDGKGACGIRNAWKVSAVGGVA